MPKILDPAELTRLLERIGRYNDGVGVDELVRTLRRRLAQLVAAKLLAMHGADRQTTSVCQPRQLQQR